VNPLLCYIRARLKRRLFVWFGATIMLTGLAVTAVMRVSDSGAPTFWQEMDRGRAVVGNRFERVWDDPAARDELGLALSRDLDVTVTLLDEAHAPVAVYGSACAGPSVNAPVVRAARPIGMVSICAERYRRRPWRFALLLAVAGAVLWAASSAIARRIAWPIGQLSRVAEELGAGRFSARVKLGRHAHGEAAALAQAINTMAARIERHLTEQRELFAAVSHELRTPLARIRLLTEMARDRGGADDETLHELDREVMEIDALVGDLLASARIDFASMSRQPIDMVEAAQRALVRAGVLADVLCVERGEKEGGAERMQLYADATLVGRALSNLLDNAQKHGGGVHTLRIKRNAAAIAVEVEDKGCGFDQGEQARVFEPFYRRGEAGSLGLGLALVKRIAEAHGGRAYAENRTEGGARVGIELPVESTGSAGKNAT
jgi:signal transduction histidine kinase